MIRTVNLFKRGWVLRFVHQEGKRRGWHTWFFSSPEKCGDVAGTVSVCCGGGGLARSADGFTFAVVGAHVSSGSGPSDGDSGLVRSSGGLTFTVVGIAGVPWSGAAVAVEDRVERGVGSREFFSLISGKRGNELSWWHSTERYGWSRQTSG
jgi:hypothetical protein